MEEQNIFEPEYLKKITDLIILSTTTENNNIRQTYFFELLELGIYLLIMNYYRNGYFEDEECFI